MTRKKAIERAWKCDCDEQGCTLRKNKSDNSMPYQKTESSVLKAYRAGRDQALSGSVYEPPLWIRQAAVPLRAFLTGYNDGLRMRIGYTAIAS